jgi:hypothetical protein
MPNTTNYSFPTPADTDLVKNGADAIRDLGDAVDTAMNTALGTKKAMGVLLSTVSFSGVSQQNVTSVFSASYYNYRIVLNAIGSTTVQNVTLRMLSGTTPNTATNYRRQIADFSSTSSNPSRLTGETSFRMGRVYSTNKQMAWADMFFPFETERTQFWVFGASQTSGDILWTSEACALDVTTSYDGFQLNVGSGNITGSVSVYGYNI